MRYLKQAALGVLIFLVAFGVMLETGDLYEKYITPWSTAVVIPQMAAAQVLGPFDPVLGTTMQTVSAAVNTTLTAVLVTPSAPLVSGTSEVLCSPTVQGAAGDLYGGAYISANNPAAGSPPNYIVMFISNKNAGVWRCMVFEHPF